MNIFFLPDALRVRLLKRFGQIASVEPLSGLTDAGVWRLQFEDGAVIIKRTTNGNEAFFYEHVSPTLQDAGVPCPELLDLHREAEFIWLVLEDIPIPFPRERWLADGEQLSILRRLHEVDGGTWNSVSSLYQPKWTPEMVEAALSWFPKYQATALEQTLESQRLEAQPLFASRCLISGDPNPLNWGIRSDGTLVHFDWERFGWGTPAIDLAITVPGLGTTDDYQTVAARYLQHSDQSAIAELGQQIKIAKAWAIVELLADFHCSGNANGGIVAQLVKEFPKWISVVCDQM